MSDPKQPNSAPAAPHSTDHRTAPKAQRQRKWGMIGSAAVILIVIAFWVSHSTNSEGGKQSKRNLTVPVALATIDKGNIDIIDPALGTVTPLANVTVRTQINGVLQEVAFQEGQLVQAGDFLAQIDPRPYQMALEQATGALQKDQALLKEAQINLARYEKLWKQDSIAKQQVDTQASLVKQYEGAVVTDQGQVNAANLNLTYCHITAPISGRVGLRQVDPGNYAETGDTNGIVTLTQLDPISVLFTLPEDQLPAVMKRLSEGAELQVEAYDRTQSTKLATGKLVSVDNQIDTSTGTVKLRAQFDNPTGVLFPNQFVNIQVLVDTKKDVVVAPQAGILRGAPGTFVYVAKADGTVAMTPVKLGVSQGDKVEVTEGLNVGDKIVVDGTDKLRDGAKYKLPDNNDKSAGRTDNTSTDPNAQKKHHRKNPNTSDQAPSAAGS